jgi:hypothetical protein
MVLNALIYRSRVGNICDHLTVQSLAVVIITLFILQKGFEVPCIHNNLPLVRGVGHEFPLR